MFFPITLKSGLEVKQLASVPTQVITPAKSRSIIGVIQDTLVGTYKSTKDPQKIDKQRFFNIMITNDDFTGKIEIKDNYSPHDIFTSILPPLNYKIKSTTTVSNYINDTEKLVKYIKSNGVISNVNNINFLEVPHIKTHVIKNVDTLLTKYKNDYSTNTKECLELIKNKINKDRTITINKDISKLSSSLRGGKKESKVTFEVNNGRLIKGVLGKKQFKPGGDDSNFVYATWQDFGQEEAKKLVNKVQQTINQWLIHEGHTIGLGDLIVQNKTVSDKITLVILKALKAYERLYKDVVDRNLIAGIGRTVQDEFEFQAGLIFNDIFSGKIPQLIQSEYFKHFPNNMWNMIASGSKGSMINAVQIMGCVGPLSIGGKRIPKTFGDRTLPHYEKFDEDPISRGFCANSYIEGLTPQEFFFHMATGREGSIDTAIKSVTGDTPIIIKDNETIEYVMIGKWIDDLLDCSDAVEYHTERNMELLKLTHKTVYIPTCDLDGNVTWGKISAITRHDPGKQLYEIKTKCGRNVIVTESKSLLIWNEQLSKLVRMNTPDVKIGDSVPVTRYLNYNGPILNHINVSDYMNNTQYIRGEKNVNRNGIATKSGYLYSTQHNRIDIYIKDKFMLNERNGFIIGLMLGTGRCYAQCGFIEFAPIKPEIQRFVMEWFDDMNIISSKRTSHAYVSACVQGYSYIIANLFVNMLGEKMNLLPDIIFNSPKEFIEGVVYGMINGTSAIINGRARITSTSEEFVNKLSMACSMIGLFSEIKCTTDYYVMIIDTNTQQRTKNDIVLDKIVSIKEIDVSLYPKVYDLTVPSTLNFGIANGLHVVDTAESGYISRRLMKSMEDLMVHYDNVVRNSVNRIKQFIYAENGLNPIYCEHIKIKLINMNYDQLASQYKLPKQSKSKLFQKEYLRMLYYQKLLREYIYSNTSDSDVTFLSPVKIDRMIRNVKALFKLPEKPNVGDNILDPVYIVTKINGLCKILPELFGNTEYNVKSHIPHSDSLDDDLFINCSEEELINNNLDINHLLLQLSKCDNHYSLATLLFRIYLKSTMSAKQVLYDYGLTKEAFDYMVDNILFKFSRAIIDGSSMVGAVAAQSIGEPTTQATLNSVNYDDVILIGKKIGENNGKLRLRTQRVKIGVFIDNIIKRLQSEKVSDGFYEYDDEMETKYADTDKLQYYVQSIDPKTEKLEWKLVEGISRHIPINEGNAMDENGNKIGKHTLIKITTSSGRTITATRGHSFMIREKNQLVKKEGKLLKVGDRIPIQLKMPLDNVYLETELDMEQFFPKDQYIWGSEFHKAKSVMEDCDNKGDRRWFSKYNGILFTIPYKRSDTAREAFKTTPRKRKGVTVAKKRQVFKKGYIYPKKTNGSTSSSITEKMALDFDFGFLIGIYLADGNLDGSRKTKVMITKNDVRVRNKVAEIAKKYNIHTYEQIQNNKNEEGWTSSTVILQSVLLSRFFEKTCSTLSHNKQVPDFAYNADIEFVKGLLSGYLTGDGCLSKKNTLMVTSTSLKMLEGIGNLMMRLNIFFRIRVNKKQISNNRGTEPENIHQSYTLITKYKNIQRLLKNIIMIKTYADDRIENHRTNYDKHVGIDIEYWREDEIPGVMINGKYRLINRDKLVRIFRKFDKSKKGYQQLKHIIETPVYHDKIIKIEYVEPTDKYTYDITVNGNHTFICNNIYSVNTFHLAGVAAKSAVLAGLPRLKELLRATKKIKTPLLQIYLQEEHVDDKYRAKVIANSVEYTTLKPFTEKVEIWFDPNPKTTIIKEDYEFVKEYYENTLRVKEQRFGKLSSFVMRLVLNKKKIIYKQLRMNFLKYKIEQYKNGQLYCINSDDNADKLVLHIRIDTTTFGSKSTVELEQMIKMKKVILDDIVIRGIKNINSAQIDNSGEKLIQVDKSTGERKQKDQWIIYTDGTNLKHVLGQQGVDSNRTLSNDVYEVYTVLGIDAARQLLYDEFRETYAAAGSVINYHHLGLLVDIMTYYGKLMPITRHGINRTDNSPLTKASFEETLEQLGEAAIYGATDIMTGISANIMCGQTMPAGTGGNFDILYDYTKAGITEDDLDEFLDKEIEIIQS